LSSSFSKKRKGGGGRGRKEHGLSSREGRACRGQRGRGGIEYLIERREGAKVPLGSRRRGREKGEGSAIPPLVGKQSGRKREAAHFFFALGEEKGRSVLSYTQGEKKKKKGKKRTPIRGGGGGGWGGGGGGFSGCLPERGAYMYSKKKSYRYP